MAKYFLRLIASAVILFFAPPAFSSTLLPARDSSACDSIFLSGQVIDSPAQKPNEPILTQAALSLENKVANLNTMAILTIPAMLFLGPIGIALAIIVLTRGAKLSKAILGHPSEKFLLKRIKRSMRIAKLMLWLYLFLALLMLGYLIYFFSLFEKK